MIYTNLFTIEYRDSRFKETTVPHQDVLVAGNISAH